MKSTPPSARRIARSVLIAVMPTYSPTRPARSTSTRWPRSSSPIARYMCASSRATVVLPVPGLPRKTRCCEVATSGSPCSRRRPCTCRNATSARTCSFTDSSPTRESSSACSSSSVRVSSAGGRPRSRRSVQSASPLSRCRTLWRSTSKPRVEVVEWICHDASTRRRVSLDSGCGRSTGGFARARAPGMGDAALPDGARPVRAGPAARRRRGVRGRAAALPGALARGQRPGQARLRQVDGLPGLPRPALDRARPDEGRRPLRRRGVARRVRGARDVDDVEVRAPAAALRRREGRRPLQPEGDVASTSCGR